jgi:8-oxo-dGTP pyrophosphatase MutT (NUDIX family)
MKSIPQVIDVSFPADLTPEQQAAVLQHPPFLSWRSSVAAMPNASSIAVRDVAFFGKRPGFIFAEANVKDADGRQIPGLAFLRGDSVAVLIEVEERNWLRRQFTATKVVVTKQPRLPAGELGFREIPAGMVTDGSFSGVAAKELKEETGITLSERDLKPLGVFYASPGGSDERIAIFRAKVRMSHNLIKKLEGRQTGLAEENESIVLELCNKRDLPARSGNDRGRDMKSVLAYALA